MSVERLAYRWVDSLTSGFDGVSVSERAQIIRRLSGASSSSRAVLNIQDYGGIGDGSTPCDDALAEILAAVGSGTDEQDYGADILFPDADEPYIFENPILLLDRSQVRFLGDGSSTNAENKRARSEICYTGSDPHFIKVQESGAGQNEDRHFTIEGLAVLHRNASFTGGLVWLDNVLTRFINSRFGYDYYYDNTHRYTAKAIHVEDGKLIQVIGCNFDHLDYGWYAPERVIQKNGFHFLFNDFNVCKSAAIHHQDTATGNLSIIGNTFNPVRQIAGHGPADRGLDIIGAGYALIANTFQGSQSGEMYSIGAARASGTGVIHGNQIITEMGCTALEVLGGSVDVRGNKLSGSPCLKASAGDLTLTGGGNELRPPDLLSGTNVSLSFSGSTVTLTDASGAFTAGMVGNDAVVSGATNAANDGTFVITAVNSATEIEYTNASGVTESGAADYSIQARDAVRFGESGNTGGLAVQWGPDRIYDNGSSTFEHSYTNWNNSVAKGRVFLPDTAGDESDSGPLWTGGSHGVTYHAISDEIIALNSDYTLKPSDSGKTFTNYTATGTITIDIPDGAQWRGFHCYIIVEEAYQINIEPQGSTTLYVGGGAKTALYTSTKGNQVSIRCGSTNAQWYGNNYGGWSTTP